MLSQITNFIYKIKLLFSLSRGRTSIKMYLDNFFLLIHDTLEINSLMNMYISL